jgi:uncharacterized protein (DUF2252 family)
LPCCKRSLYVHALPEPNGTPPPTPEYWAARQLELDRARTAQFPELFARKLARMSPSPFAFLRGAAPLFYELLESHPDLAAGPPGEGWLVGDLHLENFGAFSPARHGSATSDKKLATFNLNDFDEAVQGPWRWDVLRLLTSLILAGRELGISGPLVLELSARLLDSYVGAAFRGSSVPPPPAPVAALIERTRSRTRRALLDARTVTDGARRRFVRGDRYAPLAPAVLELLPAALVTYAGRVAPDERPRPEQLELVDAAFRIAGTGSLGMLRIAVLTRGKGDVDEGWIFDMKEQRAPSAARLVGPNALPAAERAVVAFRASVDPPPRMLATTELAEVEMVARRLTPQEDKLALRQLEPGTFPALVAYLGALVGTAHARAASERKHAAWSAGDAHELIHRAVKLAALHEAIYLEWCVALAYPTAAGQGS